MRALVVSNMPPSAESPGRGSFVRDQVAALRALGVDVEELAFRPGGLSYLRAARLLGRRDRAGAPDVVHAHFGLTAWPALALRGPVHAVTMHGTDLRHPRSGPVSRAALPLLDLAAVASRSLAERVPGAGARRRVAVLPCGVDLDRFRPLPRRECRERLGLDPAGPYVLFPADPGRRVKRHDRAAAVSAGARLLTLGAARPEAMPLWINAANAVLVPSDAEGFGLAVLEALACDVPVLATPVGVHPLALRGIAGTLCAPWDERRFRDALQPHLTGDPRVAGRARAQLFSAARMAERVLAAWTEIAGAAPARPPRLRGDPRPRRYTRRGARHAVGEGATRR